MPYIGKSPSQGVRVKYIYTATSSQTAFSGADANGVTLKYTDGEYVDVYKNGLLLKSGTDYSLAINTTMTLASGASNGDKVAIVVYDVFNVTVDDAYTKSTSDSRFINVAGDSMTGVLTIPDGSAGAPTLTNTGDTDTGLFFSAADTLAFSSGGTAQFTMANGAIAPVTDNDVDLGTSSLEFKDGYFDGTLYADAINLNGTAISSTAAELNILDGVTATAAELNIMDGVTATTAELNIMDGVTTTAAEINLIDGGTARGTDAVASGDGILINDGGTMKMTNVDTVSTYFAGHSVGGSNIVTTGALDSGSITSGFGNIDNGASNITSGGLVKLDVDADADDLTGDSATGRLTLGAGEDLNLYHGGTNSYIVNDTGDLIIDTAGDIQLDADGAEIKLLDGGTQFGTLFNTSSDFGIKSNVNDKDLVFKGEDGGSTITALTLDMSSAGAATFNNNVTAYSDERLKSNIETLDGGLAKILSMRGVTYTRNDNEEGGQQVGVIAQEIEKILPQVVLTADDEMGTKSVDYSRLTAVLIEAVKELTTRIEKLENN
jgi:hypothetical protein